MPAELESVVEEIKTNPQPAHAALDQILRTGARIARANAGAIYFADYDRRELMCVAQYPGGNFASDAAPRYTFLGASFAARVFRSQEHLFVEKPWNESNHVDQRGVQYFGIRTAILGVRMMHADRVLGVLVVWGTQPPGPSQSSGQELEAFADIAAAYLGTSVALQRRAKTLLQLPSLLKATQEKDSQEDAVRLLLAALGERMFDRVRFFRFAPDRRYFVPVDCHGMDRDRFVRQAHISVDRNPYAAHTVSSFPRESRARIYHSAMFGDDPDAGILEKQHDLPWAVVPLGLNGELVGQIVADNALTRREITGDGLTDLDAIGALAVSVIGSRRNIQFLSLNSLPELYKALASASNDSKVITHLLVYLTCGEALGFSRAAFLEMRYSGALQLTYRSSLGSLKEDDFRRIADVASGMSLSQILNADNYDYEIDQALKGFSINVGTASPDLLQDVSQYDLRAVARQSASFAQREDQSSSWISDLLTRIGETEIATIPIKLQHVESRHGTAGLFIVDRKWQPQPLRTVDLMALRTFAQLAAQALEQCELQQQEARRRSERQWENIGAIAAHALREPVARIGLKMGTLAEMLRGQTPFARHLSDISSDMIQIQKFVDDFAILAHPVIEVTMFPLLELLQESVEAARIESHARGHGGQGDLGVMIMPRQWEVASDLMMRGDRERLKGCFTEILKNSYRAIDKTNGVITVEVTQPPRGWLPVSLDTNLDYILIHFEDNGCGIKPEDQERMFEPAFTTRRDKGGSGIGLFMVQRVVKSHKGLVTCHSAVGRGATFSVFLPAFSLGRTSGTAAAPEVEAAK